MKLNVFSYDPGSASLPGWWDKAWVWIVLVVYAERREGGFNGSFSSLFPGSGRHQVQERKHHGST